MAAASSETAGRDDDLGEDLDDLAGGVGVERPVERDDAAEGRDRVGAERLAVGLGERRRRRRRRTGLACLMMATAARRGGIELGDQLVGGVGVVDVVEGELLALELAGGGDAGAAVAGDDRARRIWCGFSP